MTLRVKQDILSEMRSLDRLRDTLDVIEIVLGFLSSGGGKSDKSLGEYIDKTLQMKSRRFSQRVISFQCWVYSVHVNYCCVNCRLRRSAS